MNKTVKLICFLLAAPVFLQAQSKGKATIAILNPGKSARLNAVVAVKWQDIVAKYPEIDTTNFKVVNPLTRQEIPFQLEYRGQKEVQNLLVQLNLKSGASEIEVLAGKAAVVVKKTYGRFVPERYDDFAWENDKVAYRMYGKALEGRKDNAYGTDVWVKKTTKLIINDWYKKNDYHHDNGEGMDYYSVGFTLGAGDIAPVLKDSIVFSLNYHHWKVLDNGPLRTTFQLGYDEWNVGDRAVKVVKTISLDAGSHLNRVEAEYSYANETDLPVVVGIVKRAEPGTILMDEQQGIVGYWEAQHGEDGTTGVATITMTPQERMSISKKHLLTHGLAQKGKPFVYYNGSAWSKGKEITSAKEWFNYLNAFKQQLKEPVTVTVK
jgi:hypothetical protein